MLLCNPCVIMGYFELAIKTGVGNSYCSIIKPQAPGDIQWLRLCPSTSEGPSTIPDHPGAWCGQKTKNKSPSALPTPPPQAFNLSVSNRTYPGLKMHEAEPTEQELQHSREFSG